MGTPFTGVVSVKSSAWQYADTQNSTAFANHSWACGWVGIMQYATAGVIACHAFSSAPVFPGVRTVPAGSYMNLGDWVSSQSASDSSMVRTRPHCVTLNELPDRAAAFPQIPAHSDDCDPCPHAPPLLTCDDTTPSINATARPVAVDAEATPEIVAS